MSMPSLICDRTEQDVQARNGKGTYGASDLNRVEGAVGDLSGRLRTMQQTLEGEAAGLGAAWSGVYAPPWNGADYSLTVNTAWSPSDLPTQTDMARYLGNVRAVSGVLPEAPELPGAMEYLTWQGANAIESALARTDAYLVSQHFRLSGLIQSTAAAWLCSGEALCGG